MAARAQHGAPYDADLLSVVRVCVVGLQSLACIVLGAADGVRLGSEVYQLYLSESHLACCHAYARTEVHVERLCASHEVHSLRAEEVDSLLGVEEACLEHVVAQCVYVVLLPCRSVAHLVLLYRVEPCVGVRLAVSECGQVVVSYGDGVCLGVDLHGGELAFLLGSGDVARQQRTAYGDGLAVVVCLAVDCYACAANGVRVRHHLLQHPCAAVVLLAVVLPQAHGDGCVVERVEVDAAVPVHVLVSLAGRGDRLELVGSRAVLRGCLVSLPRLSARLVADELSLARTVAVAVSLVVRDPHLAVYVVDEILAFCACGIESELACVLALLCRRGVRCHRQPVAVADGVHSLGVVYIRRGSDVTGLCPSRSCPPSSEQRQ